MSENEHTENVEDAEHTGAGAGDTGDGGAGDGSSRNGETVLVVDGLTVIGRPSDVEIISGVSITVKRGEILGLVGESGSGKTTLGLSLLAHCKRATEITGGQVLVGDQDLAGLSERGVRELRGRAVAYIPQSPASALNPALRLGVQLREALHDDSLTDKAVMERVREVLREVALPDGDTFLRRYPHQLSGGQRQRVALARALSLEPALLVADEPTSALDVSVQAEVLDLLTGLQDRLGFACLFISHDLAVVERLASRVAVMRNGEIVEEGPTGEVLHAPRHAYTRSLVAAAPVPDPDEQRRRRAASSAPAEAD